MREVKFLAFCLVAAIGLWFWFAGIGALAESRYGFSLVALAVAFVCALQAMQLFDEE